MDIRYIFSAAVILISFSTKTFADMPLGRMIKEQQSNDNTSIKERKIEKKDVFSKPVEKAAVDSDFPQETPCYDIDELILENDFLNDRQIKNIKKRIAGKCLGVNGLQKAAVALQDHFINSGYITTRVEIPSQDLLTKKLKLRVVPGRISKVIISDNDISTWGLPFKEGDILNVRDIEQGLENIQRTPWVDVKINIIPGVNNGTSEVEIKPQRTKRWNLRTTYNNFGDKSTGTQLLGTTGYLYNLTKSSDLFYLAGTSSQTGGYKNVSTYYSIPFGYSELSLFYSSSKSKQSIDIGPYDYDYVGKTQYFSLKGARMLHRDASSKLYASAELIRRKYDYTLGGEELVLQKRDMSNLKFGVNYKKNFTGAVLDSSLSWQRFIKALGSTETPDMRNGDVSHQSQIMNLNVNYMKWLTSLPVDAYYELNLGVQYTPDNLTLQDQLTIGDRWSVRGFDDSGGIYGNKGFYIQNTLNFVTGYRNITPYIGLDYGQIIGKVPVQEIESKKIMGGITGLKGAVYGLEYDLSLSSPFVYPDNLNVDKYKVKFNFNYQL
ncbi:ShlB/FhaC/HecB family hemolysin secretion/activation protein [Klebsiella grimontii]|uniref:ShlB/FhaC/HecB family hemolysin secretion/activation protein n=1 Tax=Klebsiella grimontii TaxID=2058152 RepID=UPI001CCD8F6A|nr:ShlB/FhaC/HecB family hemolysin secretion/activation protein [Klebsiella grimontii]MBZ7675353.1 ShlB/FhaC/HecB family hemolysin secretion/activation protein [Klebsiella grimontii]